MKKILAAATVATCAITLSADEVLVKAVDRDRVLKLQDGRHIKLKAGMELIRSDNGKLYVRKPQQEAKKEPKKEVVKQAQKETKSEPMIGEQRFKWFVGLEAISKSTDKSYTYKTDNVPSISYIVFEPTGDKFKADGGSYTFDVSKDETGFAGSFGLKDTKTENRYYLSYSSGDEISELFGVAEFGFESLTFLDKAVPYLKLSAGVGFVDGLGSFDTDSFAYGFGAGVSYGYNKEFEFFGGFDMLTRVWGEIPARSTITGTTQTVSYGTEEREDSETRLYIGARYLF